MNTSFRLAARLGLAVLAVAALAAGTRAQETSPPPASVFGDVVDVRVVNVEVVVEDKNGVRVNGLQPADFKLLVDGKEASIDYFTEVRGGEAVAAADGAAKGVPGLDGTAAGSTVGTSYLVFVDDYFSLKRDRDRVLDTLSAQAQALGPNDRMAVVSYDGKRLEMLTTWSGNVATLERAFRAAKDRPTFGLQRQTELRLALRDTQLSRSARPSFDRSVLGRVELPVRDYVERLGEQVQRSVDAASSSLRGFASPPGRKVMLLLSGGWPLDPAQTVLPPGQIAIPERDLPGGPELFRPLSDTANLLGYTLYPVDVPGLEGDGDIAGSASLEERNFSSGAAFEKERQVQDSLTLLARETGGRALINSRRGQVFEAVATDTRSYYWLGFSPARKGDDKRHSVKVEVRRPGYRVRSRENFEDSSRKAELNNVVESALLFGNPPSSKGLTVTVGKPVKAGRALRVPLTVQLPMDEVTTVPQGDQRVGEMELRVAALDDEGRRSQVSVIPIRFSTREAIQPGLRSPYETAIDVRKVKQSVVVALVDLASGEMYSTTLTLNP
jgi:VWFA-related protein